MKLDLARSALCKHSETEEYERNPADSGKMESDAADGVMDEQSSKIQETQPYAKRDVEDTLAASSTETELNGFNTAKSPAPTALDQSPIVSPAEDAQASPQAVNLSPEIRTQRVRPPRWGPRSRVPGWTYALAAALIVIPGGLWIAAALTSSRPATQDFSWLGIRPEDKPGIVFLRPASGGDDMRIAVWREGNRIHGRAKSETSSSASEWSFPSDTDAKLLKTTLEDTALMIPPRGPFSLGGEAAKAAMLVCWKKGTNDEETTRISMLDRRGRVLWERPVEKSATLTRGYWISHDGVGCLAFAADGGNTLLIDSITGRVLR